MVSPITFHQNKWLPSEARRHKSAPVITGSTVLPRTAPARRCRTDRVMERPGDGLAEGPAWGHDLAKMRHIFPDVTHTLNTQPLCGAVSPTGQIRMSENQGMGAVMVLLIINTINPLGGLRGPGAQRRHVPTREYNRHSTEYYTKAATWKHPALHAERSAFKKMNFHPTGGNRPWSSEGGGTAFTQGEQRGICLAPKWIRGVFLSISFLHFDDKSNSLIKVRWWRAWTPQERESRSPQRPPTLAQVLTKREENLEGKSNEEDTK